ncbi:MULTISPECIES: VOC family protein [Delftia]|uniref:VOC family protein n=1 Tax=Delftia lacustris TaxID=558537 RepID=A0A7T3DEQ0_9BURK|nr:MULTISPECIES: VOC family protein [Delftia]QPS80700.1 VOC family protein [Delftia lacustris]
MTHTTRPAWPSPLAGRTAMKPGVAIVCGVHHVQLSFPARAQAAMERFYGEVLGLSALTVAGRPGLSFLAGGQRIDLVPYKGQSGGTERAAGNLVHLALTVSDVDALRQQLLVHGGLALEVAPVSEGRRCYARDPAGNLIELLELPRQAAADAPDEPAVACSA